MIFLISEKIVNISPQISVNIMVLSLSGICGILVVNAWTLLWVKSPFSFL